MGDPYLEVGTADRDEVYSACVAVFDALQKVDPGVRLACLTMAFRAIHETRRMDPRDTFQMIDNMIHYNDDMKAGVEGSSRRVEYDAMLEYLKGHDTWPAHKKRSLHQRVRRFSHP